MARGDAFFEFSLLFTRSKIVFIVRTVFYRISFFDVSLRETPDEFWIENKTTENILKSIWIESAFCADFQYAIVF